MPEYDKIRSFGARRRTDIIVGAILAVIVAVVVAMMIRHLLHTDPLKARLVGLPLPVETLPAKVVSLGETIGASGAVEQSATVTLAARISSRVITVPVDLGAIVKEGDLLVEMDSRLLKANLESARINADHSGKQLHRMEVLEEKGFGTAVDTEKARSDDAEARRAVIDAEIALTDTRVSSPVEGVVLERGTNPEENARPGQKLMVLGTLHPVMMVAEVSEEKIGSIRLGMPAEIGTDAFPGEIFTGAVAKVQASVSAKTRTFDVYIKVANEDLRLKPGVTGYARLNNQRPALAIPSSALMDPVGDRATVFVADKEDRAHLRAVRRGMAASGMTEILDGVQEGEMVVTVGQLELHDNDRIRPNRSGPWNKK